MGSVFRILMDLPLFRSVLKPITRVLVGLIAIPVFRFLLRRVFKLQHMSEELEKDLEEWFRGSLLLLAATANMEHLLFGWMQKVDWLDRADWLTLGLRLMLAIGVIEAMPDQELFAVLFPGPPKRDKGVSLWRFLIARRWEIVKGLFCRHMNRWTPVLAMMSAIIGAQLPTNADYQRELARAEMFNLVMLCQESAGNCPLQSIVSLDAGLEIMPAMTPNLEHLQRQRERWLVGWICYLLAITQYLIIGLVTSRDRAMEVLSEFDRAVAERRKELIEEFQLEGNLPKDFDEGQPAAQTPPVVAADSTSAPAESTSPPLVPPE